MNCAGCPWTPINSKKYKYYPQYYDERKKLNETEKSS